MTPEELVAIRERVTMGVVTDSRQYFRDALDDRRALLAHIDAITEAVEADVVANGLEALYHLDRLYYAGEPGGISVADYRAATDAIHAALLARPAVSSETATTLKETTWKGSAAGHMFGDDPRD